MASITKYRKASITVEGQAVPLRIKRLSLEAGDEFRRRLYAFTHDSEKTLTGDDAAWVRESIGAYVTLPDGALDVDGVPVRSGDDLLEVVGENGGAVLRVMLAIAGATAVSESEGKPSASGRDSVPSSDAPVPAPDGRSLAPTVRAAGPEGIAPTEDATAATARPSSGETETSS